MSWEKIKLGLWSAIGGAILGAMARFSWGVSGINHLWIRFSGSKRPKTERFPLPEKGC